MFWRFKKRYGMKASYKHSKDLIVDIKKIYDTEKGVKNGII